MERIYVLRKREGGLGKWAFIFLGALCFMTFTVLSLFVRGAYNQAREDLMEQLRKEKEVAEIYNNLKTEYAAATRVTYLELQAKRLGLKKAKEEEVLVLR